MATFFWHYIFCPVFNFLPEDIVLGEWNFACGFDSQKDKIYGVKIFGGDFLGFYKQNMLRIAWKGEIFDQKDLQLFGFPLQRSEATNSTTGKGMTSDCVSCAQSWEQEQH